MRASLVQIVTWGAVGVGAIWFVVTGAVWQFLPIGAAVLVVRIAAKAVEEPPAPEPPKPAKKGTKK